MGTYHAKHGVDSERFTIELERSEIERLVMRELHSFALEMGIRLIGELLEQQVTELCGPRRKRGSRKAYRYGHEIGYVTAGGHKVRLDRPRVRSLDNKREIELSLYRRLQNAELLNASVMRRLMRGVSCRNYVSVIETICRSAGLSRSNVSRSFIEATTQVLASFQERRFEGTRFPVIFIDGVSFCRSTLIAAIGVTIDGEKKVLSVREGATENAQVCIDLLEELRDRGLPTDQSTLFILDGSKALRSAVDRVWGTAAWIQRCRVHKLRNIEAYVPEQLWPEVATRVRTAYSETSYTKAKRLLESTAKWLDRLAPSAAASLREGLEDTLTVARLRLPPPLQRALASTNVVENVFSRVRTLCARVKRWRPNMRIRWCTAALVEAEKTFHHLRHASHLPKLVQALDQPVNQAKVA